MSTKAAKFLTTIVMHFPVRHESPAREAEWLSSIIESIDVYPSDVLDRAAKRIIATRTDRRFPLPSEIRKVCAEIVSDDRSQKLPLETQFTGTDAMWSGERRRLADDLIMTEQGRRASHEGWVLGMWHFVVRNGRTPDVHEERRLHKDAGEMVEAYRECVRGEGGVCSAALAKLGKSMLDRREELAKRVLGEAP